MYSEHKQISAQTYCKCSILPAFQITG